MTESSRSRSQHFDAWELYCEAWRECFPNSKEQPTISVAALGVFADKLLGAAAIFTPSETPLLSASGAYELKFYGTPGYVGTVSGITVHADPEVPEHTVIIRDEHGRELGRIVNVGLY
jgi:hypothetical protein